MNSLTILHRVCIECSSIVPEEATSAWLSSSLALGEAWFVLFSFMRKSSNRHVINAIEARNFMASFGFLSKSLPPLKELARLFIAYVIP